MFIVDFPVQEHSTIVRYYFISVTSISIHCVVIQYKITLRVSSINDELSGKALSEENGQVTEGKVLTDCQGSSFKLKGYSNCM